MKPREIYTTCILLCIFSVAYYYKQEMGIVQGIVALCVYGFLSYPLYFLWKKLRKKPYLTGKKYAWEFLYRVCNITLAVFLVVGGAIFYENEISPAKMPQYTLSNGEKTVYFQSMVHIGLEEFYAKVQKSLAEKKRSGAVLYYEGVKPGTEENMKKFDEAMGIKFSKDLYKNFSRLYGVTFQNNDHFLEVVNNNDYNVDISIDDIMHFYNEAPTSEKTQTKEVADLNELILKELSSLSEKELQVLVYINQGIMNFIIQNNTLQKTMMDEFGNKALFDVILGKRNEVLAEKILTSNDTKIFVLYGLLHFEGVFDMLKKQDPNWKVVHVENFYPFHTPLKFFEF